MSEDKVPWSWGDRLALVLGPLGGGLLLAVTFPGVAWCVLVLLVVVSDGILSSILILSVPVVLCALGWLSILLGSLVFTASAFTSWSYRGLLRIAALALVALATPAALYGSLPLAALVLSVMRGTWRG